VSDVQGQVPAPIAPATDTRLLVIVVYGLYLAAVISAGLAGIAGVIIAYIKRDEARGTMWESHFENQITAFWVWLILFVVGCSTVWLLGIGFLVMGAGFLYFLYRTLKGLIAAIENRAYS
jgi:uncharacterized membrane protein